MSSDKDLCADPSFASSFYGARIINNATGLLTGGTVPYEWIQKIFAENGVLLTHREKNYGINTIITARREINGGERRAKVVASGRTYRTVPVDNARKALHDLGLLGRSQHLVPGGR